MPELFVKILFIFCLPDCGSLFETGSYQLQPPERRRLAVIMFIPVGVVPLSFGPSCVRRCAIIVIALLQASVLQAAEP